MDNFDLETSLIAFSDKQGSTSWTIRDAVEGVQIFGGIGSGKTSGSGRMLALKYLTHGFGGLVLTAKPDEKALWETYCREANRLRDLVVVEPGGPYHFNFIEYESLKKTGGISITENMVQVLKTVIRAAEEKSGGKSDDPFWESALDMVIFNVIDLCLLAYGKVMVRQMFDIVLAAPKKGDTPSDRPNAFKKAFNAAQKKIKLQINAWEKGLSDEEKLKMEQEELFEEKLFDVIPEAQTLQAIDQFFVETYRNLSDKTRSIIDFAFSGFLFRLLKNPVYSLFCRHASNIEPEDSLAGKIILINLPVKEYHKVGQDAQIMFKYIWQRAMEKRAISDNGRPLFLWADEAQNFLHEYDADYQATARSSRISTVYISQNLPNYHANMGGLKSEYRVKSFLGTLATKIFHANADMDTNRYASDLIGEAYKEEHSRSTTIAGSFHATRGLSTRLEKMVRPEEFAALKTGGPKNQCQVEAFIHKQGNAFHNGLNFRRIAFKQH